ncbi:hypothetical protein EDB92DRAFT_2101087 [Lactarius akahatsu]|uniref:Uncharacterized protein n=1 Tax=Lactarius akahatsu TaxID=416441 RepID=A0AAD4QBP6_9AGAM|nr:hypothetical protein EDB92DRAFT_2101087 [Lactarius akahatsu]
MRIEVKIFEVARTSQATIGSGDDNIKEVSSESYSNLVGFANKIFITTGNAEKEQEDILKRTGEFEDWLKGILGIVFDPLHRKQSLISVGTLMRHAEDAKGLVHELEAQVVGFMEGIEAAHRHPDKMVAVDIALVRYRVARTNERTIRTPPRHLLPVSHIPCSVVQHYVPPLFSASIVDAPSILILRNVVRALSSTLTISPGIGPGFLCLARQLLSYLTHTSPCSYRLVSPCAIH